jgi:transcriptional regulator with XRE-family HTH domain
LFGNAASRAATKALLAACVYGYVRSITVLSAKEASVARRSEQALSLAESGQAAAQIREELARRRMTRQQLAAMAQISLSTLEKALSGRRPFTLATLVRVEEALELVLRAGNSTPLTEPHPGLAADALGSYARPAVAWLEGDYVTLRPTFSEPRAIYAYLTQIRWDQVASNLVFSESERIDAEYTQGGVVSDPHQSGHIYLVTNKHGQYRLIIVSRPTIRGELHGILTTLQVGRGAHLTPVSTPIVLVPLKTVTEPQFGLIKRDQPCYTPYRRLIKRTVDEPFALFLTGE